VRAAVQRRGPSSGSGRHDFELDVTIEVPPGITCVLGPSGAGKSTLLAAISGLIRPDAGRIRLGDVTWFDAATNLELPANLRRVAYVFQHLALFPHFDAVGNVSYGMARSLSRAEKHERARGLLAKLGVSHLAHRRPRTFSGGEAQRVALARALAMDPQVILLDEPFSALDRTLRIQLVSLVRDLVDELNVPMVHVTHSISEARALADRIVHIERGRVVAEGSPEQVLGKRPRDDEDDEIEGTPMPELLRK
jgi:molybdate transport system ATP-binding protein